MLRTRRSLVSFSHPLMTGHSCPSTSTLSTEMPPLISCEVYSSSRVTAFTHSESLDVTLDCRNLMISAELLSYNTKHSGTVRNRSMNRANNLVARFARMALISEEHQSYPALVQTPHLTSRANELRHDIGEIANIRPYIKTDITRLNMLIQQAGNMRFVRA